MWFSWMAFAIAVEFSRTPKIMKMGTTVKIMGIMIVTKKEENMSDD